MTTTVLEVRDAIGSALSAAFRAESEARRRPPHQLSMSGLGGCLRRAAYTVARVAPSDTPAAGEDRAANIGTWIHEGLLPRLAKALGAARIEVPVELEAHGLTIPGRADLVGDILIVTDLKSVGERKLHRMRRTGEPLPAHRVQVRGYATACVQAGYPVTWVVWIYLDRSTGDWEVVVERFTNTAALAVLARVEEIARWAALDPDLAPREEYRDGPATGALTRSMYGPGLDLACDSCWWLKRCWGDDAVAGEIGAQARLASDDYATARALALYDQASELKGRFERMQDFLKAVLSKTPAGVYRAWSLRRGRSSPRLDQTAAKRRLEELGEEAPMMEVAGRMLVQLVETLGPKQRAELGLVDEVHLPDPDV